MPSSSSVAHTSAGELSTNRGLCSCSSTPARSDSDSARAEVARRRGCSGLGGRRRRYTPAREAPSARHADSVPVSGSISAIAMSIIAAPVRRRSGRALGQQLLQERGDVSLHLDHPASRLQISPRATKVTTKPRVLQCLRALRTRTARLRLKRPERALLAQLTPLPQMRAIQPLAAQQGADLTRPSARVSLSHDRQLVLRAEPSTLRALDELRVRDPLRQGALTGRETQLAYGSLRPSTSSIQVRLGIHP